MAAVPADEVEERRISLSRGPALAVGTILLAAGLYFLYRAHGFPRLAQFPSGRAPVEHDVFLGIFGVNGWTGMGTAIAGGLLLFAAAQHLLAKAMSLIVGVVLAVAAIVALISGDVFGLAAANGWTELGWGACAVLLLMNAAVPARTRTRTRAVAAAPAEAPARAEAPAPAEAPARAEAPAPAAASATAPAAAPATPPAAASATAPATGNGAPATSLAGAPMEQPAQATQAPAGTDRRAADVRYTQRITGGGGDGDGDGGPEGAGTRRSGGLFGRFVHRS
jgi:hypothetical protein